MAGLSWLTIPDVLAKVITSHYLARIDPLGKDKKP